MLVYLIFSFSYNVSSKFQTSDEKNLSHLYDKVKRLDRGDERLVGQHHSLGHAGGAGGVHDDGRVVGGGWDGGDGGLASEVAHLFEAVEDHVLLQNCINFHEIQSLYLMIIRTEVN